jgi:peptidyl-tRNA hydrolase
MSNMPSQLITTRGEFLDALRHAFALIAAHGSREVWLCSEDFAEWPIGERAVIEHLTRWASSHRHLTVVARSFDEVSRRHARWVEWRRQWSHVVSCRANTELEAGAIPSVLLAPAVVSVRLADAVHYRGRLSHEPSDEVRCRELIDAVLQRSEEAFPASTTGL